jgi:hypothetical protein
MTQLINKLLSLTSIDIIDFLTNSGDGKILGKLGPHAEQKIVPQSRGNLCYINAVQLFNARYTWQETIH